MALSRKHRRARYAHTKPKVDPIEEEKRTKREAYYRLSPKKQAEQRKIAEELFPADSMGEHARDAAIAEFLGLESYEYLEELVDESIQKKTNG